MFVLWSAVAHAQSAEVAPELAEWYRQPISVRNHVVPYVYDEAAHGRHRWLVATDGGRAMSFDQFAAATGREERVRSYEQELSRWHRTVGATWTVLGAGLATTLVVDLSPEMDPYTAIGLLGGVVVADVVALVGYTNGLHRIRRAGLTREEAEDALVPAPVADGADHAGPG